MAHIGAISTWSCINLWKKSDQFGMACRASRSAVIVMLTFDLFFIFVILTSNSTVGSVQSVLTNNRNDASINANQFKFGDRLLPRQRHALSNLSILNSGNASVYKVQDTINNNANSYKKSYGESELTAISYSVTSIENESGNLINSSNSNNGRSGINRAKSDDREEPVTHKEYRTGKIMRKQQKIDEHYDSQYHSSHADVFVPRLDQNILNRNREKLRRNDQNVEFFEQESANRSNVSKADRLIEISTEFFIVPSSTTRSTDGTLRSAASNLNIYHTQNNDRRMHTTQRSTARPVLVLASRTPLLESDMNSTFPVILTAFQASVTLRKEPWVVPVLVLASFSMIMMVAFEVFVLFKAYRTSPSRRHLFLGQMLLLGLFSCAGLGAILTTTPTAVSCATVRFGAGVSYALVFAALLVKCVFLISLNGGVYLPAPYQGLLLLFAVLIQVAIASQWLITQPPSIHVVSVSPISQASNKFSMLITSVDVSGLQDSSSVKLCKTQFSEILVSMVYIVFLIIFVAILAIKSRGIRDNYREATYIGLAIGGTIPIWLGWTLCGVAVADRHKDACLAFGLVATSATVFLVMFMPKGRQLAAMGKEGLYVEDREEQFSSLSHGGSGYSPSFFHFKPIKYGVVGPVNTSTTNTGDNNNVKPQSEANLGGDHVALVAAAPPLYTRMYHYFPAHMTHPICFYRTPTLPTLLSTAPPIKTSLSGQPPPEIAQPMRYSGLFFRSDEGNLYTTLEPTLSSNPNVYFQRSGGVHPGLMY